MARLSELSKASEKQAQSYYDKVAEKWGRDESKLRDDLISRSLILQLARALGKGGVILDCGCGDANLSRPISRFSKQVIAFDISSAMLREAKKRSKSFRKISFFRGSILDVGRVVRPGTIDLCVAIFAVCCLKTVSELRKGFRQIRQVIKNKGFVLIQIPHPVDSFLREPSAWYHDLDDLDDYFDSGRLVRRNLKTTDGEWLLVARHHFPLSDYFKAISSAGLIVKDIYEPRPSAEIVKKHPSLARELRFPSSLVLVAQRLD